LFSSPASGATFKEISRSKFRPIPIAIPPVDIERSFSAMVVPACDLILNLQRANQKLRQTRDLLLPRLISGEIDGSDLDIGNSEPAV
jgi:type I restriction enzyme S subunit